MLNKMKLLFNILSVGLIIFTITANVVFASQSAETTNLVQGASSQIVMMAVLFGAMYFLFIRPQNKKAKEHRDLIASVAIGDEIITVGGLLGKVEKVLDNFIVINLSSNVVVTIQKQAIAQVLPKDTIKSL